MACCDKARGFVCAHLSSLSPEATCTLMLPGRAAAVKLARTPPALLLPSAQLQMCPLLASVGMPHVWPLYLIQDIYLILLSRNISLTTIRWFHPNNNNNKNRK